VYLNRNWLPVRKMFAGFERSGILHLDNHTNNRLERYAVEFIFFIDIVIYYLYLTYYLQYFANAGCGLRCIDCYLPNALAALDRL